MPLLEFAKGVGDLLPAAEEDLADDERLAVEEARDGVLGEVFNFIYQLFLTNHNIL